MIQSNTLIPTYQLAAGQYATVKVGFVSDQMLSGKTIRFNPGFYFTDNIPIAKAFQLNYPPTAGETDFNVLDCKNGTAKLIVKDAYNFDIEYSFFATRNIRGWIPDVPYLNSSALNVQSEITGLGFYVKVGIDEAKAFVPLEISAFCESPAIFRLLNGTGYVPNIDLEIEIQTDGTTSNNFYAAIIKDDAISNEKNIIPGLIQSYVKVGSDSTQVNDLPYEAFNSGLGFIQKTTDSFGKIVVSGHYLKPDSSYRIYIVYYQDGWKSCISQPITQQSLRPVIQPEITTTVTDGFGNETGLQCIKGLSNEVELDFCININEADFNEQISFFAELTGTWEDYAVGVRAFVGKGISSQTGTPLTVTGSNPYCVSGFKTKSKQAFVIFQIGMRYPDQEETLNIPFDLTFNAPVLNLEAAVSDGNGIVNELCEGGDYILLNDVGEGCLLLQSVDGSDYVESTILNDENLDINETLIPVDSEVCLKVVCDSTVTESECECDECLDVVVGIYEVGAANGSKYIDFTLPDGATDYLATVVNFQYGGGSYFTTETETSFSTDAINNNPQNTDISGLDISLEFKINGCVYNLNNININSETNPSGEYSVGYNSNITSSTLTQDCDCPEIPEPCENYAALDFDCEQETQTTNITLVKNLNSPIEDEQYLVSFDGGLSFVEAPESVIGEASMLVTYDVKFTDGCEPIHIEQLINCVKYTDTANSRVINVSFDAGTLVIEFEDDFNSDVDSDFLYVSLDAGKNFQEFDLLGDGYTPIQLVGGEDIVLFTNTIFEDGFSDLKITKSIKYIPEIEDEDCNGSYDDYDLTLTFDEETSTFSIATTGDIEALEVSELKWTLNGGNPFDENNSGVPYTTPIVGEGMFIARWKMKLTGCPERIIDAVGFGKGCIKLCDEIVVNIPEIVLPEIDVNVNYPNGPLQVCIVECCEETELSVECIDEILIVTGAEEGAVITWSGPNGFTAAGNNVPIGGEGTYTVTSTKGECVSTATYEHECVEAGEPIDDEIEI